MIVHEDDPRTRAWGLWMSGPHQRLRLLEMHDTKKSAVTTAKSLLAKNWGDYFVVRRVDLGPPTVFALE